MDSFLGTSPHRPLSTHSPPEIRVIKLFPGQFGDTIRCELEHTTLGEEDLPFSAVSYCWGDPHKTNTILLDGQDYPVTANLHAFLQHAQSLLLMFTKFLPANLKQGNYESVLMMQSVVYSILQDLNFPMDFPSASDSTLHDLVERNVRKLGIKADDSFGTAQQQTSPNLELKNLDNSSEARASNSCHLRLWIDALCINQQDLKERSQQVGLMQRIYGRSQLLLIWPQDTTTLLPDTNVVAELVRDIQIVSQPYYDDIIKWRDVVDHITSDSFLSPRIEAMNQVRQLITQKWFSRMWIIQEVATARFGATLLLGHFPISWRFLTRTLYEFCKAMASRSTAPGLRIMFLGDAKNMRNLSEMKEEYQDLIWRPNPFQPPLDIPGRLKQLLLQTTNSLATQPHDRLYALLGLLGTDAIPEEIRPDYSTPFEQVFHHYTVYLIQHTGDISFISCRKKELKGVPSWVPDWRFVSGEQNSVTGERIDPLTRYVKSSHLEISANGSRLDIDGIILGEVITVVDAAEVETDLKATSFYSRDGPQENDAKENLRRTATGVVAVFNTMRKLKILCMLALATISPGILRDDIQLRWDNLQSHWERYWPGYLEQEFHAVREMLEGKRELDVAELINDDIAVLIIAMGRELFKIAATGLGILESSGMVTTLRDDEPVRKGDIICLFNGITKPCILRQDGQHYMFIGVCRMTSFQVDTSEERSFEEYEVRRFTLV